jgi:hypothetical protein
VLVYSGKFYLVAAPLSNLLGNGRWAADIYMFLQAMCGWELAYSTYASTVLYFLLPLFVWRATLGLGSIWCDSGLDYCMGCGVIPACT